MHIDLAAVQRVRMCPRLLAVGQARGEGAEEDRDHLVHVGVAPRPPGDPPQVELVRGPGVLPVDGVPAVHDPRADQQHIVAGLAGEPAQRRGDHGAGMTAQHVPGVHVPGVAGIPGDRPGRVSEPVVVVGDRHDPGTAAPANLAVPGTSEPLHSLADEDLDGVGTFGGIGQIPHAEVALQLHRIEAGNRTGHGDSSFRRTGWGSSSRPGVHLSEAAGLTRRSASRRPTPGREARKSPCYVPLPVTQRDAIYHHGSY